MKVAVYWYELIQVILKVKYPALISEYFKLKILLWRQ